MKNQICQTVVAEIAAAEGVDPLELSPLYDYIDLDALETLLQQSTHPVSVEFDYKDYTVRVEQSEDVVVTVDQHGTADKIPC